MQFDRTARRVRNSTGLTWLPLAAWLLLSAGCGPAAPNPPVAPATTSIEPPPSAQGKADDKTKAEVYDDLRDRRAKKRSAAQGPG